MKLGHFVPLTPEQRIAHALYVADKVISHALDEFVHEPSVECPTIYYRLEHPNGNYDPTAPHPAAVWRKFSSAFENITADCMEGVAWEQGFCRRQPVRAARVSGGALNCDSMLIEASHGLDEFVREPPPELGAILVYDSVDYDQDGDRDRVGHTGTVVSVPAEFDYRWRERWANIGVVDIASRDGRANKLTTGVDWFGNDKRGKPKNAQFLRCIMKP